MHATHALGSTDQAGAPMRHWRDLAAVGLIGLCTLLAYSNSFRCGFTRDSEVIIERDERLRSFSRESIDRILREDFWSAYQTTPLYRPVTTFSFMIDWSALGHGADPAGYHWSNFFAHWINVTLVFFVARRLLASFRGAFVAATLFALHPVATEAVTNLVGRADELATLGVLAGYLCYMNAADASGPKHAAWLGGVAAASFFAMFSKENGATLVAVLFLHEWIFRSSSSGRGLAGELLSTWRRSLPAIAICAPALSSWALKRHELARVATYQFPAFVDNPIAHASQPEALLTAAKVLGRYLGLLVVPHTLSTDYSYDAIPLYGGPAPFWEDLQCWVGLAVVLVLVAYAWRFRHVQPVVAFGIFSFFVMLLPTSNVIFPIGTIMAERFLYLPLWGFCLAGAPVLIAIGNAAARHLVLSERLRACVTLTLPVLVLGALGARTFARNADWLDGYTLFRSAVHVQPASFRVHQVFASEIWKREQDEAGVDRAIGRAEIGLAVLDAFPLAVRDQPSILFNNLGTYYTRKAEFLAERKEFGEAKRFTRKAIDVLLRSRAVDTHVSQEWRRRRLAGGHGGEGIADIGDPAIYRALAVGYLRLEQWDDATEAARWARHLAPTHPEGHGLLGRANLQRGRFDDAAVNVIQALLLTPEEPTLWTGLRDVYVRAGLHPVPILDGADGPQLDTASPTVRAQMARACTDLFRLMREAKMSKAAAAFRARAIEQFSLPPELFDSSE